MSEPIPDTDHQPQTAPRIVATPRQIRDRLDLLVAGLRAAAMPLNAMYRAATEAIELADALAASEDRAVALRAIGEYHLAGDRPADALAVSREALRIHEETDNRDEMAPTLLLLARIHVARHSAAEAHEALARAREIYQGLENARGTMMAAAALGNLYAGVGDLVRAVECFNEALVTSQGLFGEEQESGDDPIGRGAIYADLAHAHSSLGDDAKAIELTRSALDLFERSGDISRQARALATLGALQASAGDADAGLDASLRAVLLMNALNDRAGTAQTMMTIATIHERAGRSAEALGTMEKALAQAEMVAIPSLLAAALIGMAGLQRRSGRQWQAAAQLERAIEILSRRGDRNLEYRAHELLAAVYEDLGAADKALDHYKTYMVLHDALRGEEKQRAIAELEVRFALAGSERDRELYRLQAERLRGELDGKSRELASITSGILQKNSALGLVLERMRERFARRPETKELLAALRDEIDRLRDPGDAWRTFEAGLDHLHHAFIDALAERHPDLSPTEVKLCVLLRADLMTRDIAALLYISERTVENHRYRLRKKMDLSASANLNAYLKSF
jgi:tetratricopeptide (TPR) repeat protein/DNA-binding CsgD family transcriptional regulator